MIGPASFKYLNSVSIENWYLEILLSLGLIGIGLFLFILFHTLKKLNRDKKYGLVVGLASVLVCALFLPTLSDNPAVTYIIFILIGMQFQIPKEKDKIALE
jgi:hypothetical protein